MALAGGTKFAGYTVLEVLGRGASSIVYRARRQDGTTVALKLLREELLIASERKATLDRFGQEAFLSKSLRHPSIVELFDWGELDGIPYMSMGLVEGEPFSTLIARSAPLPPARICVLIASVLRALDYAHQRHIVHRDVKPANVVLRDTGEPVLMDFGIAHLEGSDLTQVGELLGTPSYIAPEQLRAEPVDGRADIFATAVMTYEALTGKRPFEGTLAQIMRGICFDDPPPPSRLLPSLAPLDGPLARALAKAPSDRFQSALGFADALEALRFDDTMSFRAPDWVETVVVRPSAAISIRTLRVALAAAVAGKRAESLAELLERLPESEAWNAAALCYDEGLLPIMQALRAAPPLPKTGAAAEPWLAATQTAGLMLKWASQGPRAAAAKAAVDELAHELVGAMVIYAGDVARDSVLAEAADLAVAALDATQGDSVVAGLEAIGAMSQARLAAVAGQAAVIHVLRRAASVMQAYVQSLDPIVRFDVVTMLIEVEHLVTLAGRLAACATPEGSEADVRVRAFGALGEVLDSVRALVEVSKELLDAALTGPAEKDAAMFCGHLQQVRLIYRFCVQLDGRAFATRLSQLAGAIYALFDRLADALLANPGETSAHQTRLTALYEAAVSLHWRELAGKLLTDARAGALS